METAKGQEMESFSRPQPGENNLYEVLFIFSHVCDSHLTIQLLLMLLYNSWEYEATSGVSGIWQLKSGLVQKTLESTHFP